jgi:integrase
MHETQQAVTDCATLESAEAGFVNFLEWMLVQKTFSTSSFLLIRSGVSTLFRLVFKGAFGVDFQARLLAKKMRIEQPRHNKRKDVFDISLLLQHYRHMEPNGEMAEKCLRAKVGTMLLLYIMLRPQDMLRIDMEDMREVTGGLQFDAILKNLPEYAECSLARVEGEEAICPVAAVLELWKRVQDRRGRGKGLFYFDNVSIPLRKFYLEREMRELMSVAGIPPQYTPYSIKHASITWLLAHGVSESIINRNARLSQHASTAVVHYFLGEACHVVSSTIATVGVHHPSSVPERECKEWFNTSLNLPSKPIPFVMTSTPPEGIQFVPLQIHTDSTVDPWLILSVCELLCTRSEGKRRGGPIPQGEGDE